MTLQGLHPCLQTSKHSKSSRNLPKKLLCERQVRKISLLQAIWFPASFLEHFILTINVLIVVQQYFDYFCDYAFHINQVKYNCQPYYLAEIPYFKKLLSILSEKSKSLKLYLLTHNKFENLILNLKKHLNKKFLKNVIVFS